ncbi:hypothetical protein BCR36DRAFT_580676 [Piromyces finnis]|uniref:Uncharacterized protein n=1 Tax=Piromyces finnis TaxID=1754191 RepID=A0A1Y1VIV1_9FUNG|nr:hypothetical protein BCR36DRAFT_580676 [Piromyces finnis]|eukprot:ORX57258.1 hypothetical protein BCR36DRAFT_580676 [Piromyces finnis]
MVRNIQTFVILGLIASLAKTFPVSIDNVEEISETEGVQTIYDVFAAPTTSIDSVETTIVQPIENAIYSIAEPLEEVISTTKQSTIINEIPTDSVNTQIIEEENTQIVEENTQIVEENATQTDEEFTVASIQETIEEDVIVGVQGIDNDDKEDIIEVAENISTSVSDDVTAQTNEQENNDETDEIQFELFEENEDGEEGDDEITAAGEIDEELNSVQNNSNSAEGATAEAATAEAATAEAATAEAATAYQNLALEALNRLKVFHIFRDSKLKKRNFIFDLFGSKDNKSDENKIELIFNEDEAEMQTNIPVIETQISEIQTEVPETEAITSYIEEVQTTEITQFEVPTEIFEEETEQPKSERCINEECDEFEVKIALFDIENETNKIEFETVTEMVTEVHVVSAIIDDEQPSIALDIETKPDFEDIFNPELEDEIPLIGVIEEIDDEVQIAKKDNIYFEVNFEVIEVNEQATPTEETTDSLVISGILINLSEQDETTETIIAETATDVIEEEPSIIN